MKRVIMMTIILLLIPFNIFGEMNNPEGKGKGRSAEDELNSNNKTVEDDNIYGSDEDVRTWTGGSNEYKSCIAKCPEYADFNCLEGLECIYQRMTGTCDCTPEEFENYIKECEHPCFCEEDSHYGPPNLRLNGKSRVDYFGLVAEYYAKSTMFNDFNPDCISKEYGVDYLYVAIENDGTFKEYECNHCSSAWVKARWGYYDHSEPTLQDDDDGGGSSNWPQTWVKGHHKARHNGVNFSTETKAEL